MHLSSPLFTITYVGISTTAFLQRTEARFSHRATLCCHTIRKTRTAVLQIPSLLRMHVSENRLPLVQKSVMGRLPERETVWASDCFRDYGAYPPIRALTGFNSERRNFSLDRKSSAEINPDAMVSIC
jgi:hypothetical protein